MKNRTGVTYGKFERFDDGLLFVYGMTFEDGEHVLDTEHPINCGACSEDPNDMLAIAADKLHLPSDARYSHDGGSYDHSYWIESAD